MTQINACISYTIEDGIAVITSDNPPVNALSHAVRDGLITALASALANDTVQAVVITCRGRPTRWMTRARSAQSMVPSTLVQCGNNRE